MVAEVARSRSLGLGGTGARIGHLLDGERVFGYVLVAPAVAYILSRMQYPQYPVPMGVFRAVQRPTYDDLMEQQIRDAVSREGEGDLEALLNEGDTWTVE